MAHQHGKGEMMAGGLRVARVSGIPILVHPSWLAVFALVVFGLATGYFPQRYPEVGPLDAWLRSLAAALLFFASLLLHELGHALMARRHGLRVSSITLFLFGGVARLEDDPPDARTELKVAAAGPLVSVVLAATFTVAAALPFLGPAAHSVAGYLGAINLAVALFNLVPALPLDGGRLLHAALWGFSSKDKATRVAAGAGSAFGFALMSLDVMGMVWGQGLGGLRYVLIGWFLRRAAQGASQEGIEAALSGLRVADAMTSEVAALPGDISLTEAVRDYFEPSGFSSYPVRRGERVVGVITLRDVLREPWDERDSTSVQAAMQPVDELMVVEPDTPLAEATARLAQVASGRLLVLAEGRLVGLLTLSGVMRRARLRPQAA